ncbi:uncharacterized protein LOC124355705 [Homalodisca vitripennis]|uniref:uncharacterized protein LOC124355705 n=1 Tax=Homalodisca vitripennis TaxID=197043 RepID=UPI001EEC9F42|nr:uncharacterized protein LOC124355705 [Homalodisca vitripennis]
MSKADIDCIKADDLVWRCNDCNTDRRKSMRFEAEAGEGKLSLDDVLKAINELKTVQKNYESGVNKAFEDLNEKLVENHKDFLVECKKTEQYFKVIEDLLTENRELKNKVQKLEERLEDMEQYSRGNCLEIHGIPQEPNEDVLTVVKDVDWVRGRTRGKTITQVSLSSSCVVWIKKFLRKRRVKRNLNLSHINKPGGEVIYVNESLSPERRSLLALAKAAKRQKGYTFLWIRNGKIFLRKEEEAPVIVVTRQEHLSKL